MLNNKMNSTPPEMVAPQEPADPHSDAPETHHEHHFDMHVHEAPMHYLPVFLFIIVVLVIFGVGYGVYDWQHGKVTNLSSELASEQSHVSTLQSQLQGVNKQLATLQTSMGSSTSSTSTTVFKVPELGVEVTVPDSIDDIVYKVNPSTKLSTGQQSQSVTLSTKTLTDLSEDCSVNGDAPAFGILSKTMGQYPKNATAGSDDVSGGLIKQYSSYYIAYTSPQAICSTDTSTQTTAQNDLNLFTKALKSTIKVID